MNTFTVGLTGGIGSGKSTVGREFEARSVAVVDADAIAHQLTAPGGAAISLIRDAFGPTFVTAEGALNRVQMRAHVFSQPDERRRLETILHPMIRAETWRQADAASSAYRVLMIPLLIEARTADPAWRARFNRILVVDCEEATQVARVRLRSGLTEGAVKAIMASQASRRERLDHADDVIDNDCAPGELAVKVEQLHQLYLRLAAQPDNQT